MGLRKEGTKYGSHVCVVRYVAADVSPHSFQVLGRYGKLRNVLHFSFVISSGMTPSKFLFHGIYPSERLLPWDFINRNYYHQNFATPVLSVLITKTARSSIFNPSKDIFRYDRTRKVFGESSPKFRLTKEDSCCMKLEEILLYNFILFFAL